MTEGAATVRRRAIVSGRVQGVFFRDTCRSTAESLGLAGSVRNLSDGTVEIVAEGPRAVVEQLLDWSRSGPSRASVDAVRVHVEEPTGMRGFIVGG